MQYYQREFDAFIIDPYCSHESQCVEEDITVAEKNDAIVDEKSENKPDYKKETKTGNETENEQFSPFAAMCGTFESDAESEEGESDDDRRILVVKFCVREKCNEICEEQEEDGMSGVVICQTGCGCGERAY